MNDAHKSLCDCRGIGMLDNVATVDNAGGTLRQQIVRALQDFAVTDLAATADKDRYAPRSDDYLVIKLHVIRRIRLDDVSPEFSGLAHERDDFLFITIPRLSLLSLRLGISLLLYTWVYICPVT